MALIGHRSRSRRGESVCGDRCAWWQNDERIVMAVVDGLGHGPEAARAADAALTCLATCIDKPIEHCFGTCDVALRTTRGVALALAVLEGDRLTHASVGNIRGVLLGHTVDRRLGSASGIVGAGFNALFPETRVLAPGDTLILYTDGLDEILPLRELFSVAPDEPGDLAGLVIDRFASGADDAAMLVYRHP